MRPCQANTAKAAAPTVCRNSADFGCGKPCIEYSMLCAQCTSVGAHSQAVNDVRVEAVARRCSSAFAVSRLAKRRSRSFGSTWCRRCTPTPSAVTASALEPISRRRRVREVLGEAGLRLIGVSSAIRDRCEPRWPAPTRGLRSMQSPWSRWSMRAVFVVRCVPVASPKGLA